MKQIEYLRELKINLESQVSPTELEDILSDYESFFTAGREEGKSDDEISQELGSPAYLAKTLLDEHEKTNSTESKGETAKNIANPGRRLFAYIIDAFVAVLPALILSYVINSDRTLPILMFVLISSPFVIVPVYLSPYNKYFIYNILNFNTTYVYRVDMADRLRIIAPGSTIWYSLVIFGLVFYLLYSTLSTILFKGQTLGKRIMRIKVKRSNTNRATAGVIFNREILGKLLINSIPIVPIISLLTILLTKENKALHDMLADTIVTDV